MIQVSKFEMHSGADRNAFGNAAYAVCKAAKASSGVSYAKYFWINPNLIAMVIDADPVAWGPGSQPTAEAMKTLFSLSDLSTQVENETWVSAGEGTENFNLAQ